MTNTAAKPRIDMGQILTISVNTLVNYFFKVPREKSRRLFKEIAAGDAVGVATLTLNEDKTKSIKLKLALDHSEYKGHLTFHLFRRALELMLRNIADRLQRRADLNIF